MPIDKLEKHCSVRDKMVYENHSEKDLVDLPISILVKMQNHIAMVILFKTSLEKYGQLKRYTSDEDILIKDENINIRVTSLCGDIIIFSINDHKFSVLNTGEYGSINMIGQEDIMTVKYKITLDNIGVILKDWYKIRKDAKVNIINKEMKNNG